jgi:hypothetical protein
VNIFRTSDCPIKSAQDHCDIHCRKLLVEVLQLLSTAHVVVDGVQLAYKATHQNHPSNVWVRESKANYRWLWNHAKALSDEYTFRTGKIHASSKYLDVLKSIPQGITEENETDFRCAIPDEFKIKALTTKGLDVPKAYQLYLSHKFKEWQTRQDKRQIVATWTGRNKPEWVD